MKKKPELIPVRTFQNYFTAQITCTKLKSAGIPCFLYDSSTATVAPHLSTAIGGVKLMVRQQDADEVMRLLENMDEDYRNQAVCPRCGSKTIEQVTKPTATNILTAIISWLFGEYALAKRVYRCSTCGYESDDLPQPVEPNEDLESHDLN